MFKNKNEKIYYCAAKDKSTNLTDKEPAGNTFTLIVWQWNKIVKNGNLVKIVVELKSLELFTHTKNPNFQNLKIRINQKKIAFKIQFLNENLRRESHEVQ